MIPEQFAYWLQGFFELQETEGKAPEVTPEQAKMIREHLKTVFCKVTPGPAVSGIDFDAPSVFLGPGMTVRGDLYC